MKKPEIRIVITYVGMDTLDCVRPAVKTQDEYGAAYEVRLDCVVLHSHPITLEETQIIGELKKMYQKGDTTVFNVDAYDDSGRDTRTTLVEGSVQMTFSDSAGVHRVVRMSPGQSVSYCPETDEVTRSRVNTETITSWKNGRIVLDNTSLADALRMIENRYNVQFDIMNKELLRNRYTGRFDNQILDRVLEYFVRTTDIRFERDETLSSDVRGRERIKVY